MFGFRHIIFHAKLTVCIADAESKRGRMTPAGGKDFGRGIASALAISFCENERDCTSTVRRLFFSTDIENKAIGR